MKSFCKFSSPSLSIIQLLLAVSLAHAADPAPATTKDKAQQRYQLGMRAVGLLRAAGKHEDPEVRALVMEQWGEIRNPAAAVLLKPALADANPYVRIAAASSLRLLGDLSGRKALEGVALEKPAKEAKRGKKPSEAFKALEEMRAIAKSKVRAAAIRALGRMDSPDLEPLLRQAKGDTSGLVRDAAAVALARLGSEEEAAGFIEALKDPDDGVRLSAVRALGEIGGTSAVASLKSLASDPSATIRAALMQSLGMIADPTAIPELRAGLDDDNELVRAKAIEALSRLDDTAAVGLLQEAKEKSKNAYLQLMALRGLARIGQPVEFALVQRSLSQSDSDTRLLAVETLEAAGGEGAEGILEFALGDADMRVRVRAASALVKLLRRKS